jgi:hypothetical protein
MAFLWRPSNFFSAEKRFNVNWYNGSLYNVNWYNGNSYNTTNVATRRTAARLMNWVVKRQLVSWTGSLNDSSSTELIENDNVEN